MASSALTQPLDWDAHGSVFSLLIWSPVIISVAVVLRAVLRRFTSVETVKPTTSGTTPQSAGKAALLCAFAVVAFAFTWYHMISMVLVDMEKAGDTSFWIW